MTLLSSQLLLFSAAHRRTPLPCTILFRWNKPTTDGTVRFPRSPITPAVGLDQRVSRFVVPATAEDLLYNAGATVGVLGGAYALVRAFDELTRRNILHQVQLQSLFSHCLHADTQLQNRVHFSV